MNADAWDQGVMQERAAEAAFDAWKDREEWEVWVCPVHGVIPEGELLEGHDGTFFGSHPGTDGYTDEFFCGLDHDGPNPGATQHDIRKGAWRADAC